MKVVLRTTSLFTVVLLLMVVVVAYIPAPVRGASIEIEMVVYEGDLWINVDPQDPGTVTFTGVLYVNITGAGATQTTVYVDLWGLSLSGWDCQTAPASMTFDFLSGPLNFTVRVCAPKGPPGYQTAETIQFAGTATEYTGGYEVAQYGLPGTTREVLINQYHEIFCWCEEASPVVPTGGTAEFKMIVTNHGNGIDTIYVHSINYSRSPEMVNEGFRVTYPKGELVVAPSSFTTVSINVLVPEDARDKKTYTFGVQVRSLLAEGSGKIEPLEPLELSIVVEKVEKGGISIPSQYFIAGGVITGALVLVGAVVIIYFAKKASKDED